MYSKVNQVNSGDNYIKGPKPISTSSIFYKLTFKNDSPLTIVSQDESIARNIE
jgi:hypothetical protein